MSKREELEKALEEYHNLKLEEENIKEDIERSKTKINQLLIEADISEMESKNGVSVKRFTPKPTSRLNKDLVSDYCKENDLDIKIFYKESPAKEQLKILIPETKEKMKAYLNDGI